MIKASFHIFLVISLFYIACEQEPGLVLNNEPTPLNTIDTNIYKNDTLEISFGYFGDEEGISVISEPQYALFYSLLNKPWEERILQYIPEQDFLGTDSVILVTSKGSEGASPAIEIDTITLAIHVLYDSFHKKLIGKWSWMRSCGGFTGGCWYPDEENQVVIEFTSNMEYFVQHFDALVDEKKYHFIDSFINDVIVIYEIGFDNGYDTYYQFVADTLMIQEGDFWEEYKRIY